MNANVEFFWPLVVGLAWGAASWSRRPMLHWLGSFVASAALVAILLKMVPRGQNSLQMQDLLWCLTVALAGGWATLRCASPRARQLGFGLLLGAVLAATGAAFLQGSWMASGMVLMTGGMCLAVVIRHTPRLVPLPESIQRQWEAEAATGWQLAPQPLVRFRMTISALFAAVVVLTAYSLLGDGLAGGSPRPLPVELGSLDDEWPAFVFLGCVLLTVGWKVLAGSGTSPVTIEAKPTAG